MLSILIPIFNFDIRPLVADLHGQCEALGVGYEIVCFDDGSTPDFRQKNQELWKRPNVIYREMPQNMGRSAIRNALGRAARFDYLLFMDCDSKVVSPDFIEKYLQYANPYRLVYGGRCYQDTPPDDASLYFHWYYGRYREQRSAAERSRSVYHAFMTNNFLVPKAIFLDILFDETLRQYGHEDTLFGMELAQRKVLILHIDNPLEHIGLETTEVFLRKTEQGIENLVQLKNEGKRIETKLLVTYDFCGKWGFNNLVTWIFNKTKRLIVNNLESKNPKLKLFDLYKLGTLTTYSHHNKN
jgi:glycosyltransferase involved in cell wall biosynthesis